MQYAANLVQLHIDERLRSARKDALLRGIPVADDETLNFLLTILYSSRPTRILEIGTAVGLSAVAMAQALPESRITTIEYEEDRYTEAKENFKKYSLSDRITAHLGDAGEILPMMSGEYDFVFLDGPKAQYEKYLPDLKRLLKKGGTLFSDDVLLYGWVDGREPTPWKRHMIVEKLRSYLKTISSDPDFSTSVLDVGDGVAISVLVNKRNEG